jgi:CysZ protein
MKAINYHIRGIITTLEYLFKGKYLLFFIPGLILTGLFWYFDARLTDSNWVSDSWWLSWLNAIFAWLKDVTLALNESLYIFLVLTALSPFFTALGEKFDEELTGFKVEGGIIRFINDFLRMIFVVIISLILQGVFLFLYWLVDKMFGFPDMMDEIVKYCIIGFFFGFTFYDFALERYAKGVGGSLKFAFSAPLGMIVIGVIFKAIYAIPYVGIPLAPVLVVMISTVAYAYYIKKLPKSKQLSNE